MMPVPEPVRSLTDRVLVRGLAREDRRSWWRYRSADSLGALMLGCLALAGYLCSVLPVYYGVLAMVGVFFAFQLRKLRGPVPPQTAFALFKQHIWAGTAILFGMWLSLG